jgi:PBP1b-binding outer membrane lipoprotein LpoB
VASMGTKLMNKLASLIAFAIFMLLLCGCASDTASNPETVREKDAMRKDAAKNMPGSDIPKDPADD